MGLPHIQCCVHKMQKFYQVVCDWKPFQPTLPRVEEGFYNREEPAPYKGLINLTEKGGLCYVAQIIFIFWGFTFAKAFCSSIFHGLGYSALVVILLKMVVTGTDNVAEQCFTSLLGRSPGTSPFGFLAWIILLWTSWTVNLGARLWLQLLLTEF